MISCELIDFVCREKENFVPCVRSTFSCPELFQLGLEFLLFTRKITALMMRYASKFSLCSSTDVQTRIGRKNKNQMPFLENDLHFPVF